jgi:hypothetical protein
MAAFASRDPFAGFPAQPYSLHPYQYGYSNPILYTDPSGLCSPTVDSNGCDTPVTLEGFGSRMLGSLSNGTTILPRIMLPIAHPQLSRCTVS